MKIRILLLCSYKYNMFKMKKIITLLMILFVSLNGFSQDFKDLYSRLKTYDKQEQFDKADQEILKAVDYLLTHPYKEKSDVYLYALKSMVTWMNGTQKYAIILDGRLAKACGEDKLMLNMYMASMAKYLLHERFEKNRYILPGQEAGNPIMAQEDMWEIMLKGGEIFIPYLMNEANVSLNKDLKKFVKAYKKGKLSEALFQ